MNNRVEYKKTFWKIYHKLGLFLNLPLDSGLSFESGGGKRFFFLELFDPHRASSVSVSLSVFLIYFWLCYVFNATIQEYFGED